MTDKVSSRHRHQDWKSVWIDLYPFVSVRNKVKNVCDIYRLKDCMLFLASSITPILDAQNIVGQSS